MTDVPHVPDAGVPDADVPGTDVPGTDVPGTDVPGTDVPDTPLPDTPEAYIAALGEGPVRLGSILFTLVEPHRGWEVAYNRWYERDHFYAGCMVGPYNFAGRRFVATRDLKALRVTAPGGPMPEDPTRGSYLALYWVLDGHHDEWNRWAFREFRRLHEQGRMFPHRDHVHTQLYRFRWAAYRDADPVPAALALDHPYRGLVVAVGRAPDQEAGASLRPVVEDTLGGPVACALAFSPMPLLVDAKDVAKDEGDPQRFLHLYFLDEDPRAVWAERFATLPARTAAAGGEDPAADRAELRWLGPFIPTIPGTDTYTDELW